MSGVSLKPRAAFEARVDLSGITPAVTCPLTLLELERLPVPYGGKSVKLAELFFIEGAPEGVLLIEIGDVRLDGVATIGRPRSSDCCTAAVFPVPALTGLFTHQAIGGPVSLTTRQDAAIDGLGFRRSFLAGDATTASKKKPARERPAPISPP